MKLEWCSE
uniref:Uncharacterized protein n=1 Tax=Arundo donax TaxID=35708 RepID=A0A0A9BZH3_ARUDO